jgi:hypothetical protein
MYPLFQRFSFSHLSIQNFWNFKSEYCTMNLITEKCIKS